jgi:hypothetical protein
MATTMFPQELQVVSSFQIVSLSNRKCKSCFIQKLEAEFWVENYCSTYAAAANTSAFGRYRSLQLQHIRKKYSAKRANYFLLEDVFSIIILNPGIKFKT